MATFREIVYMVLDILKERSDDAYYTEEHIIFLASRMRAALLERKYKQDRFLATERISNENKQLICLNLVPAEDITGGCSGNWLKSVETVPSILEWAGMSVHTIKDILPTYVTFVAPERLPYVGYNKWLKSIIYCSRSMDGHLYFHSSNPQFMLLEKVMATGVFTKPEDAALLSCDGNGDNLTCSVLDMPFPLEDSQVASCIELVVKELVGSAYSPEDKINNAKDDLGTVRQTDSSDDVKTKKPE